MENQLSGPLPWWSKVFDHPLKGNEAARRLLSLKQNSLSVAEYSVNFLILAVETGWDEVALIATFTRGLLEELKNELAICDDPDSLDELIKLAIRLDTRLHE